MQIPVPVETYQGLQELNELINDCMEIDPIEEPIKMYPVNSSMSYAIGYDYHTQTLQVEFQTGAVYQYLGVDEDTWEDLQSADSIGKFFNQQIKGLYESEQIYKSLYDEF